MESLPKDPIFEYNNDTLKTLRKQYNFEKNEEINTAIDSFSDWLKKQAHFTRTEYPREYLERLIILHKGSVERAKTHMEKLCTLRTLIPHFFEDCDIRTDYAPYMSDTFIHAYLPKMTTEHQRVYFARFIDTSKISSDIFRKLFTMNVIYAEYLKARDYCDGIIVLIDLRNINIMDIVREINLVEFRQIVTISMEGFGLRVKGIHMLTTSTAIDILTKLMKQMFSTKMGNRIFVHKNLESLCSLVPKEVLPLEYGGSEKPLNEIYEQWLDVLSTKKFSEYMKMMNQARTNENLRRDDTVREQYMGIAGTFRTLSVD